MENNLIADGRSAYWASNSGEDLLGSPLPDAGIWSWDLQHEPIRLVSGLRRAQLLFIAEGFAYYLHWDEPNLNFMRRSLQRVATATPGAPEVIAQLAYSAWKTERFVYWSMQDGGGASELWRRPRGGAGAAERVASAQHPGWIVGNDSVVLRSESRSDDGNENYLVSQQLSDLSVSRDVLGPEFVDYRNYELFLLGSVLYLEYGPSVHRIPLDDPGNRRPVTPPSAEWVNSFAHDGWLYWCAGTSLLNAELTYGRPQKDMLVPAQALLQRESPRTHAGVDDSEFAIAGDTLVYWKQVEGRLFTLPLPPLPCAEQLPCPDEKRCTPAMLCE